MISNTFVVIFLSALVISTTADDVDVDGDGDDLTIAVPACNTLVACPPNSTLNACGSSCPLTCQNPEPGICNDLCVCGCECNAGFVLDESNGKCVRSCDCTPSLDCGPNAYESDSVTDYEPTCQTSSAQIARKSPSPVHRGCKCKDGFVLNRPGGECVSKCLVRTATTV